MRRDRIRQELRTGQQYQKDSRGSGKARVQKKNEREARGHWAGGSETRQIAGFHGCVSSIARRFLHRVNPQPNLRDEAEIREQRSAGNAAKKRPFEQI